jgi:hypothetical protein
MEFWGKSSLLLSSVINTIDLVIVVVFFSAFSLVIIAFDF